MEQFATASKDSLRKRWCGTSGTRLLESLKGQGLSRGALEREVGRFHGKFDLRGIPLPGSDLAGLDLGDIDFFAADLRDAKLRGARLAGSYLSEADIRGADFSFANLDEAMVDNAIYDLETSFVGVDIRRVNFNLASMLQDQARFQQRIAHMKQRNPCLAFALRVTCNYGQSLSLWAMWIVGFMVTFAVIFMHLPGEREVGFIEALYFSVITFTTVGYGDIAPVTMAGKVAVMVQASLGYMMGGLLIAILTKRLIGN